MGFLNKARKMIGGSGSPDPPRPQYFQVSCAEGHVIRGERTEGYQALRCPHCGDGVFVLPRSPLPLPPTPLSARPKVGPAKVAVPDEDDATIEFTDAPPQEDLEEIQWVDVEDLVSEVAPASEAVPPPPRPKRPRTAPAHAVPEIDESPVVIPPRPSPKTRPVGNAPHRKPEPKPAPIEDVPDQDEQAGRILVPHRRKRSGGILLVMTAVILITSLTWYYRTRKARLQELPHEAEINAVEGKEALESGRFDEAKLKLGRAAKAYRDLGASDAAAIEAMQLSDEAAIFADLGRYQLNEIIEEVARLGDVEGQSRFKAFYQGRAVFINDQIKSVKDHRIELRRRIFVGRGPVPAKQGKLDVSELKLLKDNKELKVDDRVIFGARLDSIRLEGEQWIIALQPESGVWITNAKAMDFVAPPEIPAL